LWHSTGWFDKIRAGLIVISQEAKRMRKNVIRMLMILILAFAVAAGLAVAQGRGGRGGGIVAMPLSSTAFPDGGDIPAKFIGGMGVSPELTWAAPPMGTMSFVLIMHDLDAQTGNTMGSDITHVGNETGRERSLRCHTSRRQPSGE
jgi:hypothetical protein